MKKPNNPKAPELPGAKKRGSLSGFPLLLMVMLVLTLALPTLTILVIGLMPTVVAFIVDRSKQKYAASCVGSLNLSGVFPFLYDLWTTSHTFDNALDILSNPIAIMVMYLSSAFGWVLFSVVPPVVSSVLTLMAQRKLEYLESTQKKIIEEWGDDVAENVKK